MKLWRNARIFTPVDEGRPAAGKEQGLLLFFDRGALLVTDGRISRVGKEDDLLKGLDAAVIDAAVDCHGCCLLPGFVDPHSHMCFASRRESEFCRRIEGVPYLEILRQGGGILSSVAAVKAATEDELYEKTRTTVLNALRLGTTTVEIKSGYGLDTATELKMLRVIERVAVTTPLDVVATFLGAHAIPPQYGGRPDAFIDMVIAEMLPAVKEQGIARHCDIFCEEGVFSLDQGRRLLTAAGEAGLRVKIHADEVNDLGGAGLAAELSALSADHLLAANIDNLRAMAKAGVVATLLPATAYSLRKEYARARAMIECGLAVALATDCNPGSSFTESMPFVFGLAVMKMAMTPAEALVAATLNAAYAIEMAAEVGSLTPGKQADFLLLDGETPAILAYHAGVSPVMAVYKGGEKVA